MFFGANDNGASDEEGSVSPSASAATSKPLQPGDKTDKTSNSNCTAGSKSHSI